MNKELVIEYYKNRISDFENKKKKCENKDKYYSLIRLIVAIIGIVGFILLFQSNSVFGFIFLTFISFVFVYIVKTDLKNVALIRQYENYIKINNKELNSINYDKHEFYDGSDFIDKKHPYSSDLDIFGKFSIYEFVCRAFTLDGKKLLASWLSSPASKEEIKQRQVAIKEISQKNEWRQKLIINEYNSKITDKNISYKVLDWINTENEFNNNSYLKLFAKIFPALAIILTILFFLKIIPIPILVFSYLINTFIAFYFNKKVTIIHNRLSQNAELLNSYSNILEIIEKEEYVSEKLNELKNNLIEDVNYSSTSIKKLSIILRRLDTRYNVIVTLFVNLFLLYDINNAISLEEWKEKNKNKVKIWLETISYIECLNSLGNLCFNHPEWSFPKINDEKLFLEAEEIGHPLINDKNRICNNFNINKGEIAFVTGSNMSGKSTFLRTIGVNMVLAYAGAPVCGKRFSTYITNLYSSLRVADSLEENLSSFYAELKTLERIMAKVKEKENIFVLLDEILRGTNSEDRHKGSKALMLQLIKNNSIGIVASHDLVLANINDEYKNLINYNFDVKVEQDELFFDYKLNEGVCKSFNASILMKKIGIDV